MNHTRTRLITAINFANEATGAQRALGAHGFNLFRVCARDNAPSKENENKNQEQPHQAVWAREILLGYEWRERAEILKPDPNRAKIGFWGVARMTLTMPHYGRRTGSHLKNSSADNRDARSVCIWRPQVPCGPKGRRAGVFGPGVGLCERAAREMGAPMGGPRCGDGWADESDDWVSRIVVRFDAMVTFLARSDSFLCGGADRWVNARNVLLAQIYTAPKVCFALLYLFWWFLLGISIFINQCLLKLIFHYFNGLKSSCFPLFLNISQSKKSLRNLEIKVNVSKVDIFQFARQQHPLI